MVELPEILFQEEKDSYDMTTKLKFLSVLAQLNNKAGESHSFASGYFPFCCNQSQPWY
jgi:hypothetical protein